MPVPFFEIPPQELTSHLHLSPEEEKIPLLPRLFFWFWLLFAIYTAMRLSSGEESGMHKFISWNEFYHDMLSKGEVSVFFLQLHMQDC